jgi:GNAT superfamily N-acetyltransferase
MNILITESQYKKLIQEKYIDFPINDIDPEITLEVWEEDDKMVLDTIVIPKESRKQGIGTRIMRMVCDYADNAQKPIYLTPSTSFGGTSVNRLKEFYKHFGFIINPRGGPFKHVMVRMPQ